ncbi:MAG: DNA polymerase III subunit epsilon [Betaproteobacteria bacterium]|nr:DNA polymerase III subunit epsilon [Betaproteobacteria bacterium]
MSTPRQVVLDTETTGLDPRQGHRIIEIGAVELISRRATGQHYHVYLNPEREIDPGATQVHGMTWEDLKDKPRFAEVAGGLLEFLGNAEVLIHNASFDCGFLDQEFGLLGIAPLREHCSGIIDTLRMAKELHPGKRNNLDALCERYQIDNARRTLHGALLDAQLLAEIYLAMTRGQESLLMDLSPAFVPGAQGGGGERPPVRVLAANAGEAEDHVNYLASLQKDSGGRCVWLAEAPLS